jgi:hypothetical protein
MTVARNIAERLISEAEGPALDILFASAVEIHRLRSAPSSELVWSRWSSLPAQTAIAVATVITDTELIDRIAAKEKRKTVRVALAENTNTHPITRLFYYQEGTRLNDWDLTRAAAGAMTLQEILDYLPGAPTLARNLNDDKVARGLLEQADVSRLHEMRKLMDDYTFSQLLSRMLSIDPTVFLSLVEGSDFELKDISGRHVRQLGSVDTSTLRRLMTICDESFRSQLVTLFDDDVTKLAEIDVTLLDEISSRRRYISKEYAEVFVTHGRTAKLFEPSGNSFEDDAIKYLLDVCTERSTKAKALLRHPEPHTVAELVEDIDYLVTVGLEYSGVRGTLQWIDEAAPGLGLDKTIDMLTLVAARSKDFSLGRSTVEQLASKLEVSADSFLAAVPDELLETVNSLPELVNLRTLFERAQGKPFEQRIAAVLITFDNLPDDLVNECVKILIAGNNHSAVKSWSTSKPIEKIRPIIDENRQLFAEYLQHDKEIQRSDWAVELIDLIAPAGGWGSLRHGRLMAASMSYLGMTLGDDKKSWEAALVLYEGWTGTLSELVTAARSM